MRAPSLGSVHLCRSMKRFLFPILAIALGLAGCQQEAAPDDKAMREALNEQKAVKADDLPANVPDWVREQVRAGEKRKSGGGASAPPPSASPASKG